MYMGNSKLKLVGNTIVFQVNDASCTTAIILTKITCGHSTLKRRLSSGKGGI